jgi:uncharacterized protein
MGGILVAMGFALIAWRLDFFSLPLKNKLQNHTIHFPDVLGAFAVFVAVEILFVPSTVYFFFSFLEGKFLSTDQLIIVPWVKGWLNIYAIFSSAFFLLYYFFSRPFKIRTALLGIQGYQSWKSNLQNFGIGALTWFMSYPLVLSVGQVISSIISEFYQTPHNDQVAVQNLKLAYQDPVQFYLLVACVSFLVPIIEELLFRGFLQSWLKNFLGTMGAILLTSTIFACFHFSFSQGIDNLELLLSLFVLSCFLGFLYERQGSIWAPVGLHVTFNSISIIMLLQQNFQN